MKKTVKLNIVDLDKLIFELAEDANKGDQINLDQFYKSNLNNLSKELIKINQKNIDEQVKLAKIDFEKKIKNTDEYIKLDKDKSIEIEQVKEQKQKEINQLKHEKEELFLKWNDEKRKNENFEQLKKAELNSEILKIKEEYVTKINNLTQQNRENKNLLKSQEEKFELQKKLIIKDTEEKLEKTKNNEIESLKIEINELQKSLSYYSSLPTKTVGENFENAINDDLVQSYSMHPFIEFEKANEVIKNTKPDFVITFYNPENKDEQIGKLIIEAKSKQTTEGSRKNKDFFKKLEKDRQNYQADYALLVTALEPDSSFVIYTPSENEYKNELVLRKFALIPTINLLYWISIEKNKVKWVQKNLDDEKAFINDFESFKENLTTAFENINKQAQKIIGNINDGRKLFDTLEKNITNLVSKNFKSLITANKFKTKKILELAHKIEDNQLSLEHIEIDDEE
ncbi:DUF2130 domain-containing protein [Mycoplasmopsis cricetuli]|uniref:DUF2130 domain-containing protein n=1 Tax=Mycoplasmopsis cricetuli TaxID=171283 RepID=UPI00046FDF9C|nr:DUF2130 domain-containing protein [Mycoplasmopsis cricetuli]